ncbi:flavin monoamine oxidase family protein [Gemmatimonas sp.]|jgi:monoamine oxidase|uniref:flavin monoamine oxidase family protein n=1 Tax=Gemmatimonas sp. TaxID=1962908 RepID=UPI0037C19CFB
MTDLRIVPPKPFDTDVAVVGGGLAGLTAACRLAESGQGVTLFEARSRLGGRMLTTGVPPVADRPWIDLGPAWFWPHHQHIRALVAQLALPVFEQHRDGLARYEAGAGSPPESFDPPGSADPSLRLVGGMAALTRALYAASQAAPTPVTIHLDAAVRAITVHNDHVVLNGDGVHCTAARVIVAAPPRVVARDITFVPPLSHTLQATLADTVTWMGHAMKCVATYDAPFWRDAGRSGYAVSWGGPLQEIHDACMPPHEGTPAGYALMGFVAPRTSAAARAFREQSAEARRTAVLAQLARLFGNEALTATGYAEYDWTRDSFTCGPHDDVPPAAHPEYDDALLHGARTDDPWNGRLLWAGSETSAVGGGYLEGAVASGWRAAAAIRASGSAF